MVITPFGCFSASAMVANRVFRWIRCISPAYPTPPIVCSDPFIGSVAQWKLTASRWYCSSGRNDIASSLLFPSRISHTELPSFTALNSPFISYVTLKQPPVSFNSPLSLTRNEHSADALRKQWSPERCQSATGFFREMGRSEPCPANPVSPYLDRSWTRSPWTSAPLSAGSASRPTTEQPARPSVWAGRCHLGVGSERPFQKMGWAKFLREKMRIEGILEGRRWRRRGDDKKIELLWGEKERSSYYTNWK